MRWWEWVLLGSAFVIAFAFVLWMGKVGGLNPEIETPRPAGTVTAGPTPTAAEPAVATPAPAAAEPAAVPPLSPPAP